MGDKVRVEALDNRTQEPLMDLFPGYEPFARFGDVGCLMPGNYKEDADNFRNMEVRPDDVWVITFPRSGTTWTQELVWMLMNDLDYDTAVKIPLMGRYMFLEAPYLSRNFKGQERLDSALIKEISESMPTYEVMTKAPSPRFIKTHMHFSLLPLNLLDTTKVVYVARDPRDVAVSFYHHSRMFMNFAGDFKTYWNLFIKDLVIESPFFPHLKEAWALRHHPNMLFIFYEDMTRDLSSCVERIASFFGKKVTNVQMTKLCEHLDINNFRKNESINPQWLKNVGLPSTEGFVRKGKSGGWRKQFDAEMVTQAQEWLRKNLADCDLRFPDTS